MRASTPSSWPIVHWFCTIANISSRDTVSRYFSKLTTLALRSSVGLVYCYVC